MRNLWNRRWIRVIVTSLAVVLGLGLAARRGWLSDARADKLWTEAAGPGPIAADTPFTFGTIAKLAKSLSPAVVNIGVERGGNQKTDGHRFPFGFGLPHGHGKGLGSGFVINKDGWILTNNHVVENATRIKVTLSNDHSYEAKVVGTDPRTDVALIKIVPKEPLTVAPLGDSDRLDIGEWVMAIGNPFGLSHTVTAGIVSAKGRKDVAPDGRQLYANFIQTDASINPGNSGGPLFNIRGEVVGINAAVNSAGQGIGFAIPINMVKTILPQLEGGHIQRSWLGVMIQPVTEALAQSLGLSQPRGALVAELVKQGPAAKAGIEPGDVILSFDGQPIGDSKDLPWLASNAGVGRAVPLVVWRSGKEKALQVTLGELPEEGRGPPRLGKREQEPGTPVAGLGLTLTNVSPEMADRLRRDRKAGGVLVTQVTADAPAADAGIQKGDVITKVNNQPTKTVADLKRQLDAVPVGRVLSFLVERDGRRIYIALTRP